MASNVWAVDLSNPEAVVRELVRANAEKDWPVLSQLMAHDADITSYTIGGRKYVGWPDLDRDFQEELATVQRLEMPIQELKVWQRGEVAWFSMELDYIRHLGEGAGARREVWPLRETGILEKRDGMWQLLSWHESLRTMQMGVRVDSAAANVRLVGTNESSAVVDLSGKWDILEVEDDKRYQATLDKGGNGPYTQHEGRFTTTKFADRLWQGTWNQPGNDREGGFELLLSEDGKEAKGVWWYSRVGKHKNIPPREHGGSYLWKRLTPVPGGS
ncbi:MAG: nuclear transport factor 2 family protein [Nitrospiraceae bacterium]